MTEIIRNQKEDCIHIRDIFELKKGYDIDCRSSFIHPFGYTILIGNPNNEWCVIDINNKDPNKPIYKITPFQDKNRDEKLVSLFFNILRESYTYDLDLSQYPEIILTSKLPDFIKYKDGGLNVYRSNLP